MTYRYNTLMPNFRIARSCSNCAHYSRLRGMAPMYETMCSELELRQTQKEKELKNSKDDVAITSFVPDWGVCDLWEDINS